MTAICLSCARPMDRPGQNAAFCYECADQRAKEQQRAIGRVYAAVKAGDLPPASDLICVDCGAPAAHYDHSDYTFPLLVQPVCARCNTARGPALDSQMRGLEAERAPLTHA